MHKTLCSFAQPEKNPNLRADNCEITGHQDISLNLIKFHVKFNGNLRCLRRAEHQAAPG
jgi:hypothetical protein